MTQDTGASASGPGSHPSDQARPGLGASRFDPSRSSLYTLLKSLGFNGPPLNNDGLISVITADRKLVTDYIEQRAELIDREGDKTSARQLRVTASNIIAGFHVSGCDSDRNPEGEKPQALSAKHESAVPKAIAQGPSA